MVAGTKLQLPVYAHAAASRARRPGDCAVEAAYWFVRKDRGRRIPVHLTPEVEARYADTLDVIVRSIAAGLFPAKAPESADFAWVQCAVLQPGRASGTARSATDGSASGTTQCWPAGRGWSSRGVLTGCRMS